MALKKRERKPDKIQNSQQMTLSTKFNFKFTTLQKIITKENDSKHRIYSTRSTKKENLKKRRILQFNIKQHLVIR